MAPPPIEMPLLTLQLIPGEFAVCQLPPNEPVPAWAGTAPFSSITRTADELSVICAADWVPHGIKSDGGWQLFKLVGPFEFTAVGILTSVLAPLASAGLSTLAIATFDTDYLLVKSAQRDAAICTLETAGHCVLGVTERS